MCGVVQRGANLDHDLLQGGNICTQLPGQGPQSFIILDQLVVRLGDEVVDLLIKDGGAFAGLALDLLGPAVGGQLQLLILAGRRFRLQGRQDRLRRGGRGGGRLLQGGDRLLQLANIGVGVVELLGKAAVFQLQLAQLRLVGGGVLLDKMDHVRPVKALQGGTEGIGVRISHKYPSLFY